VFASNNFRTPLHCLARIHLAVLRTTCCRLIVMPNPRSIDSAKLRATVSALTDRLARRDYDGFCGLARTSRIAASDVGRVVREYGRSLTPLPIAPFQSVDVVPISGSDPQRWSVVVPLWSQEEGRSDLSLELTVEDSPAETYPIEVDDLHVL
jgi:hypothetical protein